MFGRRDTGGRVSLSGSSAKVPAREASSKVTDLLKLIRPQQWIKNGFVFVPFVFAGELTNLTLLGGGLVVFAAFCLASSGVYVLNDLVDAEADRMHPRKARRPIASGRVGSAEAVLAMAALSAGGIGAGYLVSSQVGNMVLSYVGLSVLYSFYTKHQVLLDVFSIAGGFLLRVMAGAYASTVAPSHWILLMTLFLSLMLGLGKRRGELLELERGSENHRTVLNAYSVATIDQMLVVLVGMVVVTFSVYTGSEYATRRFGTHALVYTVPLVVYGLFRYLYVMNDKGGGGDPTEILLSDRPLLVCVGGWILACAWIIYL